MKKGRIGLLLLSLLLAAVAQNCAAPSPATDQIDTGTQLANNRQGELTDETGQQPSTLFLCEYQLYDAFDRTLS